MVYEAKKKILQGNITVPFHLSRKLMMNSISLSLRKRKNLVETTQFCFYQDFLHLLKFISSKADRKRQKSISMLLTGVF